MSRPTSGNKIIIVSRHDPGYASEREAALRGPPPARPGSASQKLTPLNLDQLSRGARPGTPLTYESTSPVRTSIHPSQQSHQHPKRTHGRSGGA